MSSFKMSRVKKEARQSIMALSKIYWRPDRALLI